LVYQYVFLALLILYGINLKLFLNILCINNKLCIFANRNNNYYEKNIPTIKKKEKKQTRFQRKNVIS
jgi:hypothetical protein